MRIRSRRRGKYLPPQPVPWIEATEFGGTVYATWARGIDKDTLRYELRYGLVGGTWASATVLDVIDGLSAQINTIPAGTWALYVDDLDSVQNYSGAPATTTVTVTLDVNAYLAAEHSHSAPTVAGMSEYRLGPTDPHRYWLSEDARTRTSSCRACWMPTMRRTWRRITTGRLRLVGRGGGFRDLRVGRHLARHRGHHSPRRRGE
ncbi:MAG: hypothetical protein IPG66_05950 [Hydrogenophilales bacterium]|nr:hypothetical protein [Hydrogenophilales bacterium]